MPTYIKTYMHACMHTYATHTYIHIDTYIQKHTHIIIIISNLSNDRSKASSKTIPPHRAI